MTSTDVVRSNSLADLAARIRTEHEGVITTAQQGLQHAMTAGQLLAEAKKQVPHGDWIAWLESNCGMTVRTAQAYMRVSRSFKHLGPNTQRVAHLSFRDALKMLAKTSSMAKLLPAATVEQTLDKIECGDETWADAIHNVRIAEWQSRNRSSLETPVALLPKPNGDRKLSAVRRGECKWTLTIGPSISRAELLQKEQEARSLPAVQSLQQDYDELLEHIATLEDRIQQLRETEKSARKIIRAKVLELIGPISPMTNTYDFKADKKTDAALAKLSQDELVDSLLAARGQKDGGLSHVSTGMWGDLTLIGAFEQGIRS